MKKYGKIINNIVDNISYVELPGYAEVPDFIMPGATLNNDRTFTNPVQPDPTQDELKAIFKQNRIKIMDSIGWIHERVQSQYVLVQGGVILTEEYNATQKLEYYRYKQLLRALPASVTDWNNITYPTPAQFLYNDMTEEVQQLLISLGCNP
jgi:hypothetical protein